MTRAHARRRAVALLLPILVLLAIVWRSGAGPVAQLASVQRPALQPAARAAATRLAQAPHARRVATDQSKVAFEDCPHGAGDATNALALAGAAAPAPAFDEVDSRNDRYGSFFARWREESADPAWSAAERESLVDLAQSADLTASVVQSVDCGATLCRIELELPDYLSATRLALAAAGLNGQYEVAMRESRAHEGTSDAPNELRYLVYAVRPGSSFAEQFSGPAVPFVQPRAPHEEGQP